MMKSMLNEVGKVDIGKMSCQKSQSMFDEAIKKEIDVWYVIEDSSRK